MPVRVLNGLQEHVMKLHVVSFATGCAWPLFAQPKLARNFERFRVFLTPLRQSLRSGA